MRMHNDTSKSLLFSSILEVVFTCVIEREINSNSTSFERLLGIEKIPNLELNFSDAALETASAFVDKSSLASLVLQHIQIAKRLFSLRALPFLPDESREEYETLKRENRESWNQIRSLYPSFFMHQNEEQLGSVLERADFNLLTFIEWLSDVDFFRALPEQRKEYLREFPFAQREG
ncbi:MAG: hypothetical protein FJY29_08430 [Betaproteobacteria bacterium]|nr:hypothetical protein [Betaproteobacteria bacterium]